MIAERRLRVRAFAKINLDLRVLNRRPDGFHELRTIFQTISLHDTLEIAWTAARGREATLEGSDIPDNLVLRAALLMMEECRIGGRVHFKLTKRIPMGGGLGGGSSDAAAVLMALPAAAGRQIPLAVKLRLAAQLGSDVPFFLLGGRAVGLGRGTELYPLPDLPPLHGLLIAPGIHVSTPEAYRALNRPIAPSPESGAFQLLTWGEGEPINDFEPAVFAMHPELARWRRKLERAGAAVARMSGSGSSLFGLFDSAAAAAAARHALGGIPFRLVGRRRYRTLWNAAK